jgi:arylformamidase
MKIWDISRPLSEDMTVYKNRDAKRPRRTVTMDYSRGSYFESRLDTDMHCGTHLDAPLHMIEGGKTIEQIPPGDLMGPCTVMDLTGVKEKITAADLEPLDIQPGAIVLLKTANSLREDYDPRFVYLEEDAALLLASLPVRVLGVDSMSVERDKPGHPVHKTLMRAGIHIVEDLRLGDVEPGAYFFIAMPLRIRGAEASPVRAVLVRGMKEAAL